MRRLTYRRHGCTANQPRSRRQSLKAEKRGTESEIATLREAFVEAEGAIRDLRWLYDVGRMRVPMEGVVSRVVAEKGAVVRAGEPLVEIYGEQPACGPFIA
jgi:multidrug resistance efflux pump